MSIPVAVRMLLLPASCIPELVPMFSVSVVDRVMTMLLLLSPSELAPLMLDAFSTLDEIGRNAITLFKLDRRPLGIVISRTSLSLSSLVPLSLLLLSFVIAKLFDLTCMLSDDAMCLLDVIPACTVDVLELLEIITRLHRQTLWHRPTLRLVMALPTVRL